MISIVIPTYNRCEFLQQMLTSFFAQKNLSAVPFELLVVDNGSSDKTKEVVESFQKKISWNIRYHLETKKGVSAARNSGIRLTTGDIIAFLDDDIEIDANWLTAVDEFFKTTGADAMGGRILVGYPTDIPAWVKDCAFCLEGPIVAHDYGDGLVPYDPQKMFVMVGANMAYKRSVLDEIGYFNEGLLTASRMPLAEDTELAVRLYKFNKKAIYCGKAQITHPVIKARMTLKYITQWYYNHGKFYVYMDDHGILTGKYKRIGGVPQYLYRRYIECGLGALLGIFNRKTFFPKWNEFTKLRGTIDELKARHAQQGQHA